MPNQEAPVFRTETLSPKDMVREIFFTFEELASIMACEASQQNINWDLRKGLEIAVFTDDVLCEISLNGVKATKDRRGVTVKKIGLGQKDNGQVQISKYSLFIPDKKAATYLHAFVQTILENPDKIVLSGIEPRPMQRHREFVVEGDKLSSVLNLVSKRVTQKQQGQIGQGQDRTLRAQTT